MFAYVRLVKEERIITGVDGDGNKANEGAGFFGVAYLTKKGRVVLSILRVYARRRWPINGTFLPIVAIIGDVGAALRGSGVDVWVAVRRESFASVGRAVRVAKSGWFERITSCDGRKYRVKTSKMTPNENLLILGAGQFGRMTQEIAESAGIFGKIDFLDDNSDSAVGKLNDYERLRGEYGAAIVAVGASAFRAEWLARLEAAGFELPAIVSPDAYVAPSARLGVGVIVEPSATIQSRATVGRGTIVSSGAVLRHDAVVGECCHCDCNSVVASGASVPNATKVGIAEVFRV